MVVGSKRRRGFTLLELVVSFAILMITFTLVVPQFNRMRSQQQCNQAAHQMFGDIRRGAAEALKGETYVVVDVSSDGYVIARVPVTSTGYSWSALAACLNTNNWSTDTSAVKMLLKRVYFKYDFPRASVSSGASTRILLGPKGWPVASGSQPTEATTAGVSTTAPLQATDGKGQYYRFTVSAGTGIPTYTVKVYTNGRVFVDSP